MLRRNFVEIFEFRKILDNRSIYRMDHFDDYLYNFYKSEITKLLNYLLFLIKKSVKLIVTQLNSLMKTMFNTSAK